MTELDELVAALRTALTAPAPDGLETKTGMLAGLTAAGPAELAAGVGQSGYHHAGYLSGHLLRWLSEHGRVIDEPLQLLAAGYAASLADPGGQAMLAKPDRPMTAHSYAAIRCERNNLLAMSESDERMLYTEQLEATFQRLRTGRHTRLGLSEPS
jgi:hypothetical protein